MFKRLLLLGLSTASFAISNGVGGGITSDGGYVFSVERAFQAGEYMPERYYKVFSFQGGHLKCSDEELGSMKYFIRAAEAYWYGFGVAVCHPVAIICTPSFKLKTNLGLSAILTNYNLHLYTGMHSFSGDGSILLIAPELGLGLQIGEKVELRAEATMGRKVRIASLGLRVNI